MNFKTKQRLLRIREIKKKQAPKFIRVNSWKLKRLQVTNWRKQRGIDSKTRRRTKNGVVSPEPGFGTPKAIRGLHPSGLEDIIVLHKEDLENLSPRKHGIRIASRLGAKKRIELIEYARGLGFHILNMGISKKELVELETGEIAKTEEAKDSESEKQEENVETKEEKEEPKNQSSKEEEKSSSKKEKKSKKE